MGRWQWIQDFVLLDPGLHRPVQLILSLFAAFCFDMIAAKTGRAAEAKLAPGTGMA